MDTENQKGLIGTILFHGLLFLCVFLMSFANPGGGGGGDNGSGEALGGLEVSLGEPDLGGPDTEAGFSPEEEQPVPEEKVIDETLTDDHSDAPEVVSKKTETKTTAPKITAPVFKKTIPNPIPKKMPDSRGLFAKKGGNKGSGLTPGNQGEDDGSINGNNGDGDSKGNGSGKSGSGSGSGNGSGNGSGDGDGSGSGSGKLDLSGFKKDREFNVETNRSGAGTVLVNLCVFRDGRIKSVTQKLGGTMTEKYFIDLAIKAVKENSYSPTAGSVAESTCGTVKFTFRSR